MLYYKYNIPEKQKQIKSRTISQPGPMKSACWIWQGAKTQAGYGMTTYFDRDKRDETGCGVVTIGIHRLMFYLYNPNEYREDLLVMHICDVPSCCNPKHLKQGTASDNQMDSLAKNRRNVRKGHTLSEDHRKKISKTMKGKRKGKPSPNKGKTFGEETRKKMSESQKKRWERKKSQSR